MPDQQRRLRYVMFLIAVSGLITVARAMSLSFVAMKLQLSFGLNPAMIGMLLGVGPLLGAVAAPFAGSVSDKMGRKRVLALTLLAMAVALMGMGIARTVMAFCLAQIVAAIAIAIYEPISRALMSDVCPEPKRLRYFSWRYTVSNVGWAIGPLIGVAVGTASTSLFIIAGIAYASVALTIHLRPVPVAEGVTGAESAASTEAPVAISLLDSIRAAMFDPRLAFFIGGGTLMIALYGQWSATIGTYLVGHVPGGVEIYAYLSSINGAVVLVGNPFARRFIERVGALPALVTGCVLFFIAELSFLGSTHFLGFALSMVVLTLGEILVVPAEYLLVDRIATSRNRGSYFGAHSFSVIGNCVGPTLGGLMLFLSGGAGMFLLFAGFAAASAAFFVCGTRMPPPDRRSKREVTEAEMEQSLPGLPCVSAG